MSIRARLLDAVTVIVGLCAISVTALAAKNAGYFGGSGRRASDAASYPRVNAWEGIVREANRIGPANAKVTVAEFADFECPACQRVYPQLDSLWKSDSLRVAIAFVHYPLVRIHPHAFNAALLAECAALQSRFPSMYASLFEGSRVLGSRSQDEWSAEAGVPDPRAFTECMQTEAGRARVERHLAIAQSLKLNGTPAFAINGVLLPVGTPFTEIADSVRAALAR